MPTGIFNNEPIRVYLEKIFALRGRTNDFRQLERRLIVVAADLDSGNSVRFGETGNDHIPISTAVQASTALPGLYPPVLIDGRYYCDGVLLKTVHASVALDQGIDVLFALNPIVPVDTRAAVERGVMRRGKLVDRGLPTVISQTLRTIIHSRMVVGMSVYKPRYPHADVILIEPKRDDYRMFFTNIFSFSARKDTCEHAYRTTLAHLASRQNELKPLLERHGLRLREDVINDPQRRLWPEEGIPEVHGRAQPKAPLTVTLDRTLSKLEMMVSDMEARVARLSAPVEIDTVPASASLLGTEPDPAQD
ncbi:MAG: lectin subunit beta, partial [Acidobacteria bacterium]|nr:lectin subunit beta [Acidobacteriota bacterium]